MLDWGVELLGHDLDLDKLASLSQPPAWTVRKRENDGRYLNGALRLEFPRSQMGRIEVGTGMESEDQPGVRTGYRVIRQTVAVSVSEERTTQSPNIAVMCTALRHDPTVQKALYHFSRGGQWTADLYKVFEIVRDDLKTNGKNRLVELGSAVSDELDNLRSVHDPDVTGDLARHGVHDRRRDPPANPMEEDAMRTFVSGLLNQWIQYKYQQLGHSSSIT
jgi:hypothetical protein